MIYYSLFKDIKNRAYCEQYSANPMSNRTRPDVGSFDNSAANQPSSTAVAKTYSPAFMYSARFRLNRGQYIRASRADASFTILRSLSFLY